MAADILLVGAGQLGSRYLQGLAPLAKPLVIYVVDPSEASLQLSRQRWEDVITPACPHTVVWRQTLESICENPEVAIVATTASVRPGVVEQIASSHSPENWILEKTLASSTAGVDRITAAVRNPEKAWVNTSRRATDWYRAVRLEVGPPPFHIEVSGGPWGLVANGVHFLDLAQWLAGASLDSIDSAGLDGRWELGKRPGSWEVFGRIDASFGGRTSLSMSASRNDAPLEVRIAGKSGEWVVSETLGLARGGGETIAGSIPPQSVMTGPVINGILAEAGCLLPSLREAAPLHRTFVDCLARHWESVGMSDREISFIQ